MKKNVFFDRDATLSYRTSSSQVVRNLEKKIGIQEPWALLEVMLTYPLPEGGLPELICSHFTTFRKEEVVKAINELNFDQHAQEEHASFRPYQDAYKTLLEVQNKGHRIGIISDITHAWSKPSLSEKELFNLVNSSYQCYSYAYGITKKHPEFYVRICERLDIDPADCVMIGDREDRDVLNPLSAGFADAVLLRHHEVIANNIETYPHLLQEHQSETKVAQSLEEAISLLALW